MHWMIGNLQSPAPPDVRLEWLKALGPIVAAIIAVAGVALTIWFSNRRGREDARYTYAAKALDLRLRQLSDFYAPLRLHLEQSRILYQKLLWSLDRLGRANSDARLDLDGFRLLDHAYRILNEPKFEEVKPLVQSILAIGSKMSAILAKNGALVEGGITPTLIEYRAHLEILLAAAKQAPSDEEKEGWQQFGYYPRILNREISEGYKEVLRHFEVFQEAGDEIVQNLLGRLPTSRRDAVRKLLENVAYYERNADSYAAKFDDFDLEEIRTALRQVLPEPAPNRDGIAQSPKLLDAGCGTGRDTEAFIKAGFEVTALDISPAMVRRCNRRIRQLRVSDDAAVKERGLASNCYEMAFDEICYRNEFDAVWASASLLHLPKPELVAMVQVLIRALKPSGVLFMSFRYGAGESEFDSRHYSYFGRRELRSLLRTARNAKVLDVWLTDNKAKGIPRGKALWKGVRLLFQRKSDAWVNVLVRKIT